MPAWWALTQMHKQLMAWSAQQQQLSGTSCPPEQHMQAALQLPRPALCTSWSKTHCGHWPLISLCFPGLSPGRFPATRVAFLHQSASEAPGNPALYLGCGEFPWALPSDLTR